MTTTIICAIIALLCYIILIYSNHRLRKLNEFISNKNIELMVEISKLEYDLTKARECRKRCEKAKLLKSNKKRYLDYVYLTDDEYNKLLELFWKEKLIVRDTSNLCHKYFYAGTDSQDLLNVL